MKNAIMAAALMGLCLASPLRAADNPTHAGSQQLTDLASTYNVQESELLALRDKGWSWNEVGNSLAISKRAGKPLQEVVTQRDSGMGWNQIANQYGFKFSEVSREAKQVAKKGNRADKEARKSGEAIQRGEPSRGEMEQPRSPQGPGPGMDQRQSPDTQSVPPDQQPPQQPQ